MDRKRDKRIIRKQVPGPDGGLWEGKSRFLMRFLLRFLLLLGKGLQRT